MNRYIVTLSIMVTLLLGCNYETAKVDGTISGYTLPTSVVIASSIHSEVLGSGTADDSGYFSIRLNEITPQAVSLVSSGGEYYEVGEEFPTRLDESVKRHGHVNYINGKDNKVNFHYLSNLSAGLTEYYVNLGADLEDALIASSMVIEEWTGIDPSTASVFEGVDRGISQSELESSEDSILLAFMEKGLSFLALETNRLNDLDGYDGIESHDIITASYEDIMYDGIINGITASQTNASGSVTMDADYLRHQHSLSIAKFLYSDENKSGIESIEMAQRISRINEAPSEIFDDAIAIDIPEDSPYLRVGGIVDNGEVSRNVLIEIDSFDYSGVRSLSISFDDYVVEIDPLARNYVLDTSIYRNEDYEVKLVAENTFGQITEVILDVTVLNELTDVGELSPSESELIGNTHTLSALIPDTYGINSVRFLIDDDIVYETFEVSTNLTFEYDTSGLTDGTHNFRVDIISNAGNITYKTIEFESDNSPPILDWALPIDPILDLQQNFTATVSDDQLLKSVKFFNNGVVIRDYEDAEGVASFDVDFTIDVRSIYEGTHTMAFEATSASGIIELEEREFLVDWANPYINIITPSGTNVYDTETFTFQADDSNGLKDGATTMVSVEGETPFMIDSSLREFTLTNSEGKREELLLEVTVEDLVGRTSTDSILVKYNSLSLGDPVRTERGSSITYTFTVLGLSNEFYTIDLQPIAPTTEAMLTTSGITSSQSYSNGVGTYSFTFTEYSNVGHACDYIIMDYSMTVLHRGMTSDLKVLQTNPGDYISGENCVAD